MNDGGGQHDRLSAAACACSIPDVAIVAASSMRQTARNRESGVVPRLCARTVVLAKFCSDRHLPPPATTPSAGSSLKRTSRQAALWRAFVVDARNGLHWSAVCELFDASFIPGVVAPMYVDLATPELRGGHECRGEQRLQGLVTGYFEPASEIIGHSRVAFSAAVRSSLFSALR